MKVSRAQAEENRRTVVEVAARLFREHGFEGIGLNDLMHAAGLTRGGFYKQFTSKDELVAEACACALAAGTAKWQRAAAEARDDVLAELVHRYLSTRHRDRIGEGCAFAALAADAARHGAALRPGFEDAIRAHAGILAQAMQSPPSPAAGNAALAALSTMVGALLLSRTVADEALSRRILDSAAAAVLAQRGVPQADG